MTKIILPIAATCVIVASCGSGAEKNTDTMENQEINTELAIYPKGDPALQYFTGNVYVQPLVRPAEIEGLYSVGQVTFEPGARTFWHTHPAGQVLLVTGGKGWYQQRGKAAEEITAGSVVAIPKDVEHWHGASADQPLVHIAISNMASGNSVTWMTPVTDEEYDNI